MPSSRILSSISLGVRDSRTLSLEVWRERRVEGKGGKGSGGEWLPPFPWLDVLKIKYGEGGINTHIFCLDVLRGEERRVII